MGCADTDIHEAIRQTLNLNIDNYLACPFHNREAPMYLVLLAAGAGLR